MLRRVVRHVQRDPLRHVERLLTRTLIDEFWWVQRLRRRPLCIREVDPRRAFGLLPGVARNVRNQ